MIKIDNISFWYNKTPVIKDFSLQIDKGDRICLFGESGCGKTTLLRLILGLIKPKTGKIHGITKLKASAVFQENRLLPFKTVIENITLFGASRSLAEDILEKFGILEYKDALPSQLSGGMLQRVAIARAIANDFDFLVLDEPFVGLDSHNISVIAKTILEICGNKPIIMVTHNLSEAELLGCKIINM